MYFLLKMFAESLDLSIMIVVVQDIQLDKIHELKGDQKYVQTWKYNSIKETLVTWLPPPPFFLFFFLPSCFHFQMSTLNCAFLPTMLALNPTCLLES